MQTSLEVIHKGRVVTLNDLIRQKYKIQKNTACPITNLQSAKSSVLKILPCQKKKWKENQLQFIYMILLHLSASEWKTQCKLLV